MKQKKESDELRILKEDFNMVCEKYAHVLWYLEDALKGFQRLSRKNKSWKSEYEAEVNAHVLGMIKKLKDALKVVES